MIDISGLTRAHGFPVKQISGGGSSINDSYYGDYSAVMAYDWKSKIGEPSDLDPSLCLANVAIRRGEGGLKGYADLSYQAVDATQSGIVDSGVPVWTCRVGALEKPLETHPDYRTLWNYNLVLKKGQEADPPEWALEAKTLEAEEFFKWVKDEVPENYNLCDGYERQLPGVESYILPSPVVESTLYYSDIRNAYDALKTVGTKTAPEKTFGYDGGEWLVMGADISKEGKKWAVRVSYQWAQKWEDKLYGDGGST